MAASLKAGRSGMRNRMRNGTYCVRDWSRGTRPLVPRAKRYTEGLWSGLIIDGSRDALMSPLSLFARSLVRSFDPYRLCC